MTQRLIGLILGAGTGLLLGGQLVIAADRIDLFDTKSKRTRWGTITQGSGTVQVYDKDGNRVGSGTLPTPGVKR